MAKHLHQLDLFGAEIADPVTIKAPKENLKIYKTQVETNSQELKDEALPSVSRAPMSLTKHTQVHKRGRKSFASMDAEINNIQVPTADELVNKLYYPIGEVAIWFNVNTSLIRYWEKEFKQLQPRKTRKGDRLFRAQDIEFLKQIYYLLREKKYSIEGAKNYLKNNKEKADKDISLLNSLKDIKTFLISLKASL